MATINVNNFTLQTKLNDLYSFPCRPKEVGDNSFDAYCNNLKVGHVFAYSDDSPKLLIHKFARTKNSSSILVMCEREGSICEKEGFMPWLIAEITYKNGVFNHYKLASYFEKDEADKEYCAIMIRMEWQRHI